MRMIALALCLAACSGSKSKNATPSGTKIIEWDASKSTREAFKSATFENRTTRDETVTIKVCADDVKLKLHMEPATAKYTEDGQPVEIAALASLTITVEDGKGFEIKNAKCDGPNYQLTAPGTPPGYTIIDCHFKATKPNNECAPFIQLKGDGTLMK